MNSKLIIIWIFYLLNPVLGLIITIFVILEKECDRDAVFYSLIIMISVYMALITTTVNPDAYGYYDMYEYRDLYMSVPKMSFGDFMLIMQKEVLFFAYLYFAYYLTFGIYELYVFMTYIMIYSLMLWSIYIYAKVVGYNVISIIVILVSYAFFEFQYNININLMRQAIASAILLYIIVEKIFNDKNHYILVLCALLIHSTVIPFFILLYMPGIKQIIRDGRYQYFMVSVIIIVVAMMNWDSVYNYLYEVTAPFPVIQYPLSRLGAIEIIDNSGVVFQRDWLISYYYMILMFFIGVVALFFHVVDKRIKNVLIIYLCFVVFMMINIISGGKELLVYRFSVYEYIFTPFILFLGLYVMKDNDNSIKYVIHYAYVVYAVVIVVRFYRWLFITKYDMIDYVDALLWPVFMYFI